MSDAAVDAVGSPALRGAGTQLSQRFTGAALQPRSAANLCLVLATLPGPKLPSMVDALAGHRVRVTRAGSLHDLLVVADRVRPDVVVVDLALAGSQAEVLRLVRTTGVPLIVTSVRDLALRVALLLAGAADCLTAPFAPEELTARIIAVVRRLSRSSPSGSRAPLAVGPLRVDVRARRVTVDGSEVFLTAREYDLLRYFAAHQGEVLSRERLMAEVWGYTVGDVSTVTVHVRRLRSKVEVDPSRPELIHTVWGVGYRCAVEPHGVRAGPIRPPGATAV